MPIKGVILILLVAAVFAVFYSDAIYRVVRRWFDKNKKGDRR